MRKEARAKKHLRDHRAVEGDQAHVPGSERGRQQYVAIRKLGGGEGRRDGAGGRRTKTKRQKGGGGGGASAAAVHYHSSPYQQAHCSCNTTPPQIRLAK
jgi:hypothetical protein